MEFTEIKSKEKKVVAVIEEPITEQWLILSLPSNTGWVGFILPDRSQIGYPLRPGAIASIPADYIGDVVIHLGWPGQPLPEAAGIVFFSSEEQGEVEALYLNS